MTNEVLNTMKTRRSCRCYLDKMPEPEALNAVLEAGTWAPTGMGRRAGVSAIPAGPGRPQDTHLYSGNTTATMSPRPWGPLPSFNAARCTRAISSAIASPRPVPCERPVTMG